MSDVIQGPWPDRETDEEAWLRSVLAWIEGVRASRVGTGRTITVHIDVLGQPR